MRGGEAQALTFGDGGGELQGTAHDEVGQNGRDEGCRSRTSGNLEFASVFNIIPARGSSIYRVLGLMISCVSKTSPTKRIRCRFG
jgi:hypothetical protein